VTLPPFSAAVLLNALPSTRLDNMSRNLTRAPRRRRQ
jgi:hypothetical protein